MLRLGQCTPWGKIAAIGIREGERFYMMVDKRGGVALIPSLVAEAVTNYLTLASANTKENP